MIKKHINIDEQFQRIQQRLKDINKSENWLKKQLNISNSRFYNWKKRGIPGKDWVFRVAEILECDPSFLKSRNADPKIVSAEFVKIPIYTMGRVGYTPVKWTVTVSSVMVTDEAFAISLDGLNTPLADRPGWYLVFEPSLEVEPNKVLYVKFDEKDEHIMKYVRIAGREFFEPIVQNYPRIEITPSLNYTVKGVATFKGFIGEIM